MFAILLALGCGVPVVSNHAPEQQGTAIEECPTLVVDCCTADAECLNFFGPDFPYCYDVGDFRGGYCAECVTNRDCEEKYGANSQCYPDPDIGAYCY